MASTTTYPGGWKPIRYEVRCRERRVLLDAALERAVAICRARHEIERLVVFGSYAREAISAWSDLDLLVVVDDDAVAITDALNAAARYADVLGMLSRDADLRLTATPLGRTILREGRIVYARPTG